MSSSNNNDFGFHLAISFLDILFFIVSILCSFPLFFQILFGLFLFLFGAIIVDDIIIINRNKTKDHLDYVKANYPNALNSFLHAHIKSQDRWHKENIYNWTKEEQKLFLTVSTPKWQELEKKELEIIRNKHEDIDDKIASIHNEAPNGLAIWLEINNYDSIPDDYYLKGRLLNDSKDIYKYESFHQQFERVCDWIIDQADFGLNLCSLIDDNLLHDFYKCSYSLSIDSPTIDGLHNSRPVDIWHLFRYGYCLESDLDYSLFPLLLNATRFINSDPSYKHDGCLVSFMYSGIIIEALISVFDPSSIAVLIDDYLPNETSLFKEIFTLFNQSLLKGLEARSITHYYLSKFEITINALHYHNVIIISFQRSSKSLIEYCQSIIEKDATTRPCLGIISLFKDFDRDFMINWINYEEKKVKQAKEKAQQDKLFHLSHTNKTDSDAIISYLTSHGIHHLYHFTDRRNLESIKQKGGLYSWQYCVDNGIVIPYPGGDDTSRLLDTTHGLSDYVRLSFCDDHPMQWRLEQNGAEMVLLKVKIDVAGLEGTLFSDMNATDNMHHHGGTLEDLKRINLAATQENYVSRDSSYFKEHQAEVMVKTYIPLEYILFP